MTSEQPNPYTAPSLITHEKILGHRFAKAVITTCFILTIAMLIAQQYATAEFATQGIALPVLTHWFLNPLVISIPLFCIAPVWATRSWESKWLRSSVCLLVLLFTLFWTAVFSLSMYLPIAAIRSGLGL